MENNKHIKSYTEFINESNTVKTEIKSSSNDKGVQFNVGDKVYHPEASAESPNHIGEIIKMSRLKNGKKTTIAVDVKFRDFTEGYDIELLKKVNTYSPDLVNTTLTPKQLNSYVASKYAKEYCEYGTKESKDWDVDDFKSFVSDSTDSDDNITNLDKGFMKLIFKKSFNIMDLNIEGSSYNDNKNFKKYKNWGSALYDIWEEILKNSK